MTNARKLLAASVAVVLGAVLFGLSGFSAREASAQLPPARFAGTVKVDGAAVAAGTLIEARIDGALCGQTTTFMSGADARYVLESPQGCGAEGKVVSFYIGGKLAAETGSWLNYQLNLVDLTYVTPTPTPTPTATATASATASPTTPSATPKPPSTGSGTESGSSAATMLFAALGLGALAFGTGGVLAARRGR